MLHWNSLGLRSPQEQNDKAHRTDDGPKDIRAVNVQADEHVRRDPDDGELEEPVQRHVRCVAHATDPSRVDLGAV